MVRSPPIRPDFTTARGDPVASLARAAVALGSKVFDDSASVGDLLKRRSWGDDRTANILTRSSVTPAMTTQAGWAAELAHVSQAFLRSLVPMSAAAQLIDAGLKLAFDGAATITLPLIVPGSAHWVAEGMAIRVPTLPVLAGQSLTPSKLATIIELTNEVMNSSNIEAITKQALIDASAASLDASLFSNVAAVPGLSPAGILVGAASVTPSTSTNKAEAMDDDVAALVEKIAPYAGNGSVAFVLSPPQGARLVMRAERVPGTALMSAALPAGTVIAIATNSFVSALEPIEIDAAKSAVIYRDDTNPQPPPAGPASSLFQCDCSAIRMRLPVTWAVRQPGAVAVVTATKW